VARDDAAQGAGAPLLPAMLLFTIAGMGVIAPAAPAGASRCRLKINRNACCGDIGVTNCLAARTRYRLRIPLHARMRKGGAERWDVFAHHTPYSYRENISSAHALCRSVPFAARHHLTPLRTVNDGRRWTDVGCGATIITTLQRSNKGGWVHRRCVVATRVARVGNISIGVEKRRWLYRLLIQHATRREHGTLALRAAPYVPRPLMQKISLCAPRIAACGRLARASCVFARIVATDAARVDAPRLFGVAGSRITRIMLRGVPQLSAIWFVIVDDLMVMARRHHGC